MAEAAAGATRSASFAARVSELPALLEFARGYARSHGLPDESIHRLIVVLEELFLNTVYHGHGGGSDAPVSVSLSCAAGRIDCLYKDTAPAFAPAAAPPGYIDGHPEAGPLGGLGVIMARSLASGLSYAAAPAGRGNRIVFSIEPAAAVQQRPRGQA